MASVTNKAKSPQFFFDARRKQRILAAGETVKDVELNDLDIDKMEARGLAVAEHTQKREQLKK